MTLESLRDRELHRGPSSSRAFNERNRRIKSDIDSLYHDVSQNDAAIKENMDIALRENFFMQNYIDELKGEVNRLRGLMEEEMDTPRGENHSVLLQNFYQGEHIRNGEGSRAAQIDRLHGVVSPLPTNVVSRISYETDTGRVVTPKGLEIYMKEAKNTDRDIDGNLVYYDIEPREKEKLIDQKADTFWVRNVTLPTKDGVTEVFGEIHFKLPIEGLNSLYANAIQIHPYPEGALSIQDIQYKGHGNQWSRLEHYPTEIRDGEELPKTIRNARKLLFQFNRTEMTEVRIFFSQPYAFEHENQSSFTYGFQGIDIQHRMHTERKSEFITILDVSDKHAELSRVHAPEITPAPGTPQNTLNLVSHKLYYDESLQEEFDFGTDILTPLSRVYIKTTLQKQGDTVPVLKEIRIPYVFKDQ